MKKEQINEHTDQWWTWWWILIPNTTGSWTCAVRINSGEEGNLNLEWESCLLLSHNECFPLRYFNVHPLGISLVIQWRVTMSIWNCFYTDMRKPHSHVFNVNEVTISLPEEESTCNAGDLGSIPGLGRSPGGGHGNPLQYILHNKILPRLQLVQNSAISLQ